MCSRIRYIYCEEKGSYTHHVYNLAFGFSCANIASATFFLWILPVAVLGMLSVKKT
jgi:hypothetical protein